AVVLRPLDEVELLVVVCDQGDLLVRQHRDSCVSHRETPRGMVFPVPQMGEAGAYTISTGNERRPPPLWKWPPRDRQQGALAGVNRALREHSIAGLELHHVDPERHLSAVGIPIIP